MYREQLIPCCPSGTPRLLDKDELAMESQQGAEGPEVEQKEHEVGGTMWGRGPLFLILDTYCKMNNTYLSLFWVFLSFKMGGGITVNAILHRTICHF